MKTVEIRPYQVRRFLPSHTRVGDEIVLQPVEGQPAIFRAIPRAESSWVYSSGPLISVDTIRDETELLVDVVFDSNPAAPAATIELKGETFVLEHVRGFFYWKVVSGKYELRVSTGAAPADAEHGTIECDTEEEARALHDDLSAAVERWWVWRSSR